MQQLEHIYRMKDGIREVIAYIIVMVIARENNETIVEN